MKRSELTEFEVEEEGFKIKIKRGLGDQPVVNQQYSIQPLQQNVLPSDQGNRSTPPLPVAAPIPAAINDDAGFTYIKSPMVGTFYRSASPDSPPFADLNTKVDEKSVACIIEAMKIMNEIQAETKGSIVEVLVENGQPVEYGQRLFKVKSA